MEEKKRVTILVIIALILAITAVVLNVTDSEMSTTGNAIKNQEGEIGVVIIPTPLEDKLAEETIEENP